MARKIKTKVLKLENERGFTVRQLIAALQNFPQDVKIVLSSDVEGSGYGLCGQVIIEGNGNVILYPIADSVQVDGFMEDEEE